MSPASFAWGCQQRALNKEAVEQKFKLSKTRSSVGRRMGRARALRQGGLWVGFRNVAVSPAWLVWRGLGKSRCRHSTGGDRDHEGEGISRFAREHGRWGHQPVGSR